jgi:hypothetical protein
MGLTWSSTSSDADEYSDSDVEAGKGQSAPSVTPVLQPALTSVTLEQASELFSKFVEEAKITKESLLGQIPAAESDAFDLEQHVEMAKTLLKVSPLVNEWRFKLVPGRIKEQRFWCTLFYRLRVANGNTIPQFLVAALADPESSGKINAQSAAHTTKPARSDSLRTSDLLARDMAPQADHKLQHHLEELYQVIRTQDEELARLRQRVGGGGSSGGESGKTADPSAHVACDRCGNVMNEGDAEAQRAKHKGEYELDKDSKEFLALDEPLQENLRSEKLKRLKEVCHAHVCVCVCVYVACIHTYICLVRAACRCGSRCGGFWRAIRSASGTESGRAASRRGISQPEIASSRSLLDVLDTQSVQ